MHDTPAAAVDLSLAQTRTLRCLVDLMIPASAEFGVPSAAEAVIFEQILQGIGRDRDHVLAVLRALDETSGGAFADLEGARRNVIVARLQETGGAALTHLMRIVLQSYYRDDRVMRSLEMELRPPFPKGFEVEQGDWSLLDPVRARPPFYRAVPPRAD